MAIVICIETHAGLEAGKSVIIRRGDRLKDTHSDVVSNAALYAADGSSPSEIAAARAAAGVPVG